MKMSADTWTPTEVDILLLFEVSLGCGGSLGFY